MEYKKDTWLSDELHGLCCVRQLNTIGLVLVELWDENQAGIESGEGQDWLWFQVYVDCIVRCYCRTP